MRISVTLTTAVVAFATATLAIVGAAAPARAADQTGRVTVNGPTQNVNIATAGARSLFAFSGTVGQRVTAQITQATWPNAAGNSLSLINTAGTVLASRALTPSGTLQGITLTAPGTYRVVVDLAGASTGTGRLGLVDWAGPWSGTVVQGTLNYPMSLVLNLAANQAIGTVEYPSLFCGANTTQVSRTTGQLTLTQTITHGPGACVSGQWTFTRVNATTLNGNFQTGLATVTLEPINRTRILATGNYSVTYGAPGTVSVTGNVTTGFTMTAKRPIRVTGAQCSLPAGTVLATFSKPVNNVYTGIHNLYFVNTCAPAGSTSLALDVYGTTFYSAIGNGERHIYVKV